MDIGETFHTVSDPNAEEVDPPLEEQAPPDPPVIFDADPDDILLDEDIDDIRIWNGHSAQEQKLPDLARSIEEEGQLESVKVWQTEEGFKLIDGKRRMEAIKLLRSEGKPYLLRVEVVPEVERRRAWRMALLTFTTKADLTPLEFARAVRTAKKNYRGNVSELLCVSEATISQAEKLLDMPDSVLRLVAAESDSRAAEMERFVMSAKAALEVATSPAPVREKVVEKAKEIATAEAAKEAKEAEKGGDVAHDKVGGHEGPAERVDKPAPAPTRVTTTHVRKAQAAVEGKDAHVRAPRMSEVAEWFDQLNGPGTPPLARIFAGNMAEWCHGKLAVNHVQEAWDFMVAKLPDEPAKVKAKQAMVDKFLATGKKVEGAKLAPKPKIRRRTKR